MSEELWKEFNLRERNPDQAGGILYCLRYNSESLNAKRDQLISILDKQGLKIKEIEDQLAIGYPKKPSNLEFERANILLEEFPF